MVLTDAAISYVAGYTAKKTSDLYWRRYYQKQELINNETGELYYYQTPFLQMSRRPGIGHFAKNQYWKSWRSHAIHSGTPVPVPRYLHNAWKDHATEEEIKQLEDETILKIKEKQIHIHSLNRTQRQHNAIKEVNANAKQTLQQERRQTI